MLLGALGGRGEDDGRRRGGVVRPVMLAEAEHVEADLVGKLDLFDQIAQPLMRADVAGALVQADIGKSVETEFHVESSSECVFTRRGRASIRSAASHGQVNSAYRILLHRAPRFGAGMPYFQG